MKNKSSGAKRNCLTRIKILGRRRQTLHIKPAQNIEHYFLKALCGVEQYRWARLILLHQQLVILVQHRTTSRSLKALTYKYTSKLLLLYKNKNIPKRFATVKQICILYFFKTFCFLMHMFPERYVQMREVQKESQIVSTIGSHLLFLLFGF